MATDGLKQRLVGGATLLVVAVIAWFWLLSADSPVDPVSRESQIPVAPDIQPFAVQEPQAPQNIAPIGSEQNSEPALQSDVVPQRAPQRAPQGGPQASIQQTPKQASQVDQQAAQKAVQVKTPQAEMPPTKAPQPAPTTSIAKPQPQKAAPKSQPAIPIAATVKPEAKPTPKAAKDSKLAAETFQLDQHGLPIAWVVQVGLFSTQASADKIKATLQEKGFKAYTEPFKSDKASGIKVFVGPKLSRERADAQKAAVDQLLKTNTMVVRFVAN